MRHTLYVIRNDEVAPLKQGMSLGRPQQGHGSTRRGTEVDEWRDARLLHHKGYVLHKAILYHHSRQQTATGQEVVNGENGLQPGF